MRGNSGAYAVSCAASVKKSFYLLNSFLKKSPIFLKNSLIRVKSLVKKLPLL